MRALILMMMTTALTSCGTYQTAAPVDAVEVHDVKGHR